MTAPTVEHYLATAVSAANEWGLGDVTPTLLNLSENVVLRLDTTTGPKVMRLHRPGYNSLDELTSEVAWVQSLGDAGIVVPRALPTREGEFYRPVEVALAQPALAQPAQSNATETRYAGIVEWIDGVPLRQHIEESDADPVPYFADIGALMGRLCLHGQTWSPPADFTRRRWDRDGFVGESPLWGRFWESNALTASERELFEQIRDRLDSDLAALSMAEDTFGLIHADLHLANVMVDGPAVTMIDFDDAGFGWNAHELAVALHEVRDEPYFERASQALFEGYDRVIGLSDHVASAVDLFLVVRALMLVGWLDARPELATPDRYALAVHRAVRRSKSYLGA